MLRVLTSGFGLRRHFGEDGAARVMAQIETLKPAWGEGEPVEVRLLEEMGSDRSVPSYLSGVLIVGGARIVSHFVHANPVRSRTVDPDATVLHDDLYGGGLKGVPVGRLPDLGPGKVEAFLDLLEGSAQPPLETRSSLAVSNRSWTRATREVFRGHPNPLTLRSSPGWKAKDLDWRQHRHSLLYFNLHGFVDRSAWRGFDTRRGQWVDAVLPSQIDERAVRGSVVVAENCYGANATALLGAHSVASTMLACGARAFIGATGLAYSSHSPIHASALGNADLLGRTLIRELEASTFGEALWTAKKAVQKFPGPYADKTWRQFVLYGNPRART